MSETREPGKGVLIARGVWGVIGFSSCLLLALAGGGHPAPHHIRTRGRLGRGARRCLDRRRDRRKRAAFGARDRRE